MRHWLLSSLVRDLLACGATLAPDQVFSFGVPPSLSGPYVPENLEPADVSMHLTLLGSIQRQIRDLPEGTVFERFIPRE